MKTGGGQYGSRDFMKRILMSNRILLLLYASMLLSACNKWGDNNVAKSGTWHYEDLKKYPHVEWCPLEPMPLSPDKAIKIALESLEKQGVNAVLEVETISLEKMNESFWIYNIYFQDNEKRIKLIRVLLSGDVWQPRIVKGS